MMGLLMALITLVCIYTPVCRSEGCSRFRNLDNGQTFFRYSGLLVIFRCRPGYKLHGHKTNSCVSGHWSRDPPVCVASGCSYPGPLTHGTSTMNEDGSWVEFSCDGGFRLRGPSTIYCKGHTWNATKPVCKESDMMSSLSDVQRLNSHQGLFASPALKIQQQSHDDHLDSTSSKDADVKFDPLSRAPSQTSTTSDRITADNPNMTHQQESIQLLQLKVKHRAHEALKVNESQRPETETESRGSSAELSGDEEKTLAKESQLFASEFHQSTTVSSTMSLVSGTERSTSSSPTFPTARTPAVTPFTAVTVKTFSLLQQNKFPLPVLASQELSTSHNNVTPSGVTTVDQDQQGESGPVSHFLFHRWPADKTKPTETSPYTPSTPANSLLNNSSSSSSPAISTSSEVSISSNLFNAAFHLDMSTDSGSQWTERTNVRMNTTLKSFLSIGRRPVCPYPPVPAHGTFYFRNVENPGPKDYKHYIQYACYPGYTLANGDIHSYCQHGGTWSGITPVCLELTPCSVNNGGCSQLCSHSRHYNHSSNHNQTRAQCRCRPGFTLLEDGQTCRDLDECLEGHHHCPQRCLNTFGSFKCTCDDGYQLTHQQIACTDVDECLLPVAVTGCVFGCINTPGSFYCKCPAGYSLQSANDHCQDIDECVVNEGLGPCMEHCHNSPGSYRCSCTYGRLLAGDGHSCVSACPTGYRKQATATPGDAQTLKEECVDIDECQENMCEWQCINLPGSHRCICPRGYTLQRDGRRCKDINECNRRNGGCSHMCLNQRGGYKCACPATHRLSPYSWKKCLPRTTANMYG